MRRNWSIQSGSVTLKIDEGKTLVRARQFEAYTGDAHRERTVVVHVDGEKQFRFRPVAILIDADSSDAPPYGA